MAEITALDALQAFHQELRAIREGRNDGESGLSDYVADVFNTELRKFWENPLRSDKSREMVKTGKDTFQQPQPRQLIFNRHHCSRRRPVLHQRTFSTNSTDARR